MKWLIPLFVFLAIAVDVFIYRRIRNATSPHKWMKRAYLTSVIAIDLGTVAAILCMGFGSEDVARWLAQPILWAIGIFMISLITKSSYVLLALFDFPLSRLFKRRIRWASCAGILIAFCLLVGMVWGASEGRNHIEVKEVTLSSERLPKSFDGYRILFFSDMHLGTRPQNNRFLDRLAQQISILHPDIVVNGGDLLNQQESELTPQRMTILSKIKGRDGVYSVLGNHDLGFYLPKKSRETPRESVMQLIEKQKEMGWQLLNNESLFITRGRDSIVVSGTNYPRSGFHSGRDSGMGGCDLQATYRNIPDSLFNVMIAHTPQNWDSIRLAHPADLTLSGHVHAMQLKLPFGAHGWSPSRWMYKRWSGLYQEGKQYLYVNDGLGYVVYPIRIGTYPELTLITLRATAPTSAR